MEFVFSANFLFGTPLKINMEPKNHLFDKENHLPNLHGYVPCYFSRVYHLRLDYLIGPSRGTEAEHASEEMAKELGLWRWGLNEDLAVRRVEDTCPPWQLGQHLWKCILYMIYIIYNIYIYII